MHVTSYPRLTRICLEWYYSSSDQGFSALSASVMSLLSVQLQTGSSVNYDVKVTSCSSISCMSPSTKGDCNVLYSEMISLSLVLLWVFRFLIF